ncbi:MAG TPA: hypothetical protein VMW10_05700, partial [Alphaproteobacteria bacterium]|nr:hypothetical protein [Alphaproteobacteria bacterium]
MWYFSRNLKRSLMLAAFGSLALFGVWAGKNDYLGINASPASPKKNNRSKDKPTTLSLGSSSTEAPSSRVRSGRQSGDTALRGVSTKNPASFGDDPYKPVREMRGHQSFPKSSSSDPKELNRAVQELRKSGAGDNPQIKQHTQQFQQPGPRSTGGHISFPSPQGSGSASKTPLTSSFPQQQNVDGLKKLPLPNRIRNFIEEKLFPKKDEEKHLRSEPVEEDGLMEDEDLLKKEEDRLEEKEKEKIPDLKRPVDKAQQENIVDEVRPKEPIPQGEALAPAAPGATDFEPVTPTDKAPSTKLASLAKPIVPVVPGAQQAPEK